MPKNKDIHGSTIIAKDGKYQHFSTNGYNVSQANKIFEYAFGEFFIKSEINDTKTGLNIYLRSKLEVKGEDGQVTIYSLSEQVDVKYFSERFEKRKNTENNTPLWKLMIL